MYRATQFLRRSWPDQRLLIEALLWLCWARLLLSVAPFRWITPHLGECMAESPAIVGVRERELAARIQWAVQAAVRHAPMTFVCLPQALTAKWMLRRRRLPSTLYLGLQRQESTSMTAHAWLRVGEQILTGREESLNHQPVATFSELGFP